MSTLPYRRSSADFDRVGILGIGRSRVKGLDPRILAFALAKGAPTRAAACDQDSA